MSASLKFIGVLQIVIAVVIGVCAFKIDPGVAEWSKQLGNTCREFSKATELHKKTYEQSSKSLGTLRTALKDAGEKIGLVAKKMTSTGGKFKQIKIKLLKSFFDDFGVTLSKSGENVKTLAKTLDDQANVLKQYENNVYPQTVASFESAIQSLNMGAAAMDKMSDGSNTYVKMIAFLIGIFFFLNGIAMFIISNKKCEE